MIAEAFKPLNAADLAIWADRAAPGNGLTYHEGQLAIDRARGPSALPERSRIELNRVAARALALAEGGAVLLVQRRLNDDCIAYIAIKARSDKPRRI